MFSPWKISAINLFFKYEFCKHKALEINPVLVELGCVQREMHLMVRHLGIFRITLSTLPLHIYFFQGKICPLSQLECHKALSNRGKKTLQKRKKKES